MNHKKVADMHNYCRTISYATPPFSNDKIVSTRTTKVHPGLLENSNKNSKRRKKMLAFCRENGQMISSAKLFLYGSTPCLCGTHSTKCGGFFRDFRKRSLPRLGI